MPKCRNEPAAQEMPSFKRLNDVKTFSPTSSFKFIPN